MNPLKKLAGQTVIYGMGSMLPRLINYAFMTPFFTDVMSKSIYGVYTILYSYVAFAMILLPLGMETSFFRYANTYGKDRAFSAAFISIFSLSVLFLLFSWWQAPALAHLMGNDDQYNYLYLFTSFVALDALACIPFAKFRQEGRALKFAIFRLVNVLLLVSLNFLFLLGFPSIALSYPDSLIAVWVNEFDQITWVLIANLIASATIFILLSPAFFQIKWRLESKVFKQMLIYALPLVLVGFAGWINEHYDKILLQSMTNDATVGIYGANYKIAILMILFVQMFRYAAEPFFFNESKKENAHKTYADVMQYFVLLGWLFFLGVNLYIDVVKYFVDKKFWEGVNAVPVVMLAYLCFGIYFNLSIWYKLTNKTHYGAIISGIGAGVTLLANYLLIPYLGYMGSAWATFICFFAMMLISYFWGQRIFPVKYPLKKILWYSCIALLVYFVSLQINVENLLLKLSINTALIFLYTLLVIRKELKYLKQKLAKKLHR